MQNICKSFGKVEILKNVNLNLETSQIHALMGENGAGKSTLIKILTGVYSKDEGQILIDDNLVHINSIYDSQNYKIAYVHQELNIVEDLSISENIFLGRELQTSRIGTLDKKSMDYFAHQALKSLDITIAPNMLMRELSLGYQQMVEISKALILDAKLIVLDEPTTALTEKETKSLFSIIKNLQSKGVSFLYVSHRMNEIFELCEKVSVLRDGHYVGTRDIKEISEDDLVEMMIGKKVSNIFSMSDISFGREILKVENLSCESKFENVSFSLREGEILGFAGLMGSGRSEIMHCLFGSKKPTDGSIYVNGEKKEFKSPIDAKKNGIAFLTENRKLEGLILDFSIEENVVLSCLEKFSRFFIKQDRLSKATSTNIQKLNIKCQNLNQKVKDLSGGNQQKVVLSKWIETNPKILILDEPTRGVDVGAKKEIYTIINSLKTQNIAIIIVSSELNEVVGLSDRIAVMHQHKLAKIFDVKPFNQDEILKVAFLGEESV